MCETFSGGKLFFFFFPGILSLNTESENAFVFCGMWLHRFSEGEAYMQLLKN